MNCKIKWMSCMVYSNEFIYPFSGPKGNCSIYDG